jgi:hypothetical protein
MKKGKTKKKRKKSKKTNNLKGFFIYTRDIAGNESYFAKGRTQIHIAYSENRNQSTKHN